jgi:hypothetical protein
VLLSSEKPPCFVSVLKVGTQNIFAVLLTLPLVTTFVTLPQTGVLFVLARFSGAVRRCSILVLALTYLGVTLEQVCLKYSAHSTENP